MMRVVSCLAIVCFLWLVAFAIILFEYSYLLKSWNNRILSIKGILMNFLNHFLSFLKKSSPVCSIDSVLLNFRSEKNLFLLTFLIMLTTSSFLVSINLFLIEFDMETIYQGRVTFSIFSPTKLVKMGWFVEPCRGSITMVQLILDTWLLLLIRICFHFPFLKLWFIFCMLW